MGRELTAICDIDPNLAERVPQIRTKMLSERRELMRRTAAK